MSQTLQNQMTYAKTMSGIISLSDGAGSTIENGTITSNTINTDTLSSNNFILPRNSTPAVIASLGPTINVEEVLENVYFGHIDRLLAITNDFGGNMMLFNTASNILEMQPDILNIYPDTQLIITTTTNFSNGICNFINCPIVASNNTTLTIPRISTAAVKTLLGNSIELCDLLQNFNFKTGPRIFEFYSDSAAVMFDCDVFNNNMNIRTGTTFNTLIPTTTLTPTLNTHFTTLGFNNGLYGRLASANAWTNTNSYNSFLPTSTLTPTSGTQLVTKTYTDSTFGRISFSNVWTNTNSYNSFLPTSTLTPTTATQFVTKGFCDGAYARLSISNSFSENNIFLKGILPRTTLTATNIQIGANQMANRQATSLNNIGIGENSVAGDQNPAGFVYNTGSNNIGIGKNALQTCDGGSSNIGIGVASLQYIGGQRVYGLGVLAQRNIAIGENSQNLNIAGNDNVTIGYNSFNSNISGQGNVMIGSNTGNGLSDRNFCLVLGTNSCPSAQDNQIVSLGYNAMGAATGTANSIVAVGPFAGYNNTNGTANQYFGALAGYDNFGGSDNCFVGYAAGTGASAGESCCYFGRVTNSSISNPINSSALGFNAQIQESFEVVLGGSYGGTYPRVTIPNKTRLACNQSLTGVTINLAFRTNENILLTDATTTTINLPTPATANIGCKYFIQRQVTGLAITINAPSGQLVSYLKNDGTYTTASSYTFAKAVANIRLLCINDSVSGANWLIMNTLNAEASDTVLVTTPVSIPATKYSIPFGGTTSSAYQTLYMDNTNLNYQASTNTLTATNLVTTGSFYAKINYLPHEVIALPPANTALPNLPNLYGVYTFVSATANTTITLPNITNEMIGCMMQFRRLTNASFQLIFKTAAGSGVSIVQRASIAETAENTNYVVLTTAQFYISIVAASLTKWCTLG